MPLKQKSIQYQGKKITFWIRPKTTDEKVIHELFRSKVYFKKKIGFGLEEGDVWLDLGGNIGTFAVQVLAHGGSVYSYEPEPENFEIMKKNIQLNRKLLGAKRKQKTKMVQKAVSNQTEKLQLYLCKGDYNKYRHTLFPIRGRESISIHSFAFSKVLTADITAVKMDIEGSEIEILEGTNNWKNVKKLVFEYHFDRDSSVARFRKIIKKLRKHFTTVFHPKIPAGVKQYKFYPPAQIVYCIKK